MYQPIQISYFIIFKTVKMIMDTIIHGYQLHSVYGCGIHLCGALCSSLTHLLVRTADRKRYTINEAALQVINQDNAQTQTQPLETPKLEKAIKSLEQISLGNLLSDGGGVTSRGLNTNDN